MRSSDGHEDGSSGEVCDVLGKFEVLGEELREKANEEEEDATRRDGKKGVSSLSPSAPPTPSTIWLRGPTFDTKARWWNDEP